MASVGGPAKVSWIGASAATIGFIVSGLLVWLRTRFIWWPLHPIGLFLGFLSDGGIYGNGNTAGIVYLAKWLVFRIGGVKLYDEWGKPIATGFCLGFGVVMVVWGLVGAGRCFVF